MKIIGDCMKRQVVAVSAFTMAWDAARVVVENHIGTLPVVDKQGVLVGVVRVEDVLQVFMPDFVTLLDNIDFVHHFGAWEDLQPNEVPEAECLTMGDLMGPPVEVEENCGLLRAFATMVKHELRDLPVVNEESQLVGIASRVDIAVAFLTTWTQEEPSA
jgi:CBS domain-containing protein